MNYRPLGDTGLRVSEVGFGTWGLGGDSGGSISYGPTSDDTSRAALRSARELGVNFFDTADFYGFGHAEELLGEEFSGRRDDVVIASKGGFVDARTQDFSIDYLREALENSLRRLRTDHVDLYQLHSPAVTLLREHPEIIALMKEFQASGKIRAWGFSARSPGEARIAVEEFQAPCIQVNFNLTDQRAAQNGLFDLCRERRARVSSSARRCVSAFSPANTRKAPASMPRITAAAGRPSKSSAGSRPTTFFNSCSPPIPAIRPLNSPSDFVFRSTPSPRRSPAC